MKKLEEYVRSIPDFPEEGIIFRDITSVIQDPDGLQLAIDGLDGLVKGTDYDVNQGDLYLEFLLHTRIISHLFQ